MRTCPVCGAPVIWPKKKFCSDECFRRDRLRRSHEMYVREGESPTPPGVPAKPGERACAVCGGVLPPRRTKYCCFNCQKSARSNALKRQWADSSANRPVKKCARCGADLPNTRDTYCAICRSLNKLEANRRGKARFKAGNSRKIGSTCVCERCGGEYILEASPQKYCAECGVIVRREKGRAYQRDPKTRERKKARIRLDPEYEKICPVCGVEFSTKTNRQIYCSKHCYSVNNHKLNRQKRREKT